MDTEKKKSPTVESKEYLLNGTKNKVPPVPESQQSWFSRYALQIFVANFSLLQFFQMTTGVYWIGIVRTVEKRFGLSSTQTNFIMSVNDLVHICLVIFVGYFGRKGHKPRIIAATSLFLVIGSLLMATPYFIYGEELPFIFSENSTISSAHRTQQSLCNDEGFLNTTNECSQEDTYAQTVTNAAWYIFVVASAFNGFGGVAMQVLGMAYVDENADKSKSSIYLGIITSTFALGPICGIFLAAFTTSLPENLQPTDKSPTDPSWIGAWWVGYILCAAALLMAALPMFFYPKCATDRIQEVTGTNKKDESLAEQAKEFPRAMVKLMSNGAFVSLLITGVCSVYVIAGVYMNTPRYLEIHFLQPAFKANIAAGLPGLSGVIGGFIGGVVMSKLKFGPVASAKMVVMACVVGTLGLFAMMFISCPKVDLAGDWSEDGSRVSLDTACNAACSCSASRETYQPVCGDDGFTYFSPCYAGCSSSQTWNGTMFYDDCLCLSNSTATTGICNEPCDTQFYMFTGGMLLMSLLTSLARVPGTIVQFRIVGKDEGSFALGVTSFAINLLGFIPGPIIFGLIIDSTCVLWQEVCDVTGACLFYDTQKFRYHTYGLSVMFQTVSAIFSVVLVIAIIRMKLPDVEDHEMTVINDKTKDSNGEMLDKVSGV